MEPSLWIALSALVVQVLITITGGVWFIATLKANMKSFEESMKGMLSRLNGHDDSIEKLSDLHLATVERLVKLETKIELCNYKNNGSPKRTS